MKFRTLAVVIISCLIWVLSWCVTPEALAMVTNIQLLDISYKDCPPEFAEGSVTSGGNTLPGNCFIVTGKAKNNSGKTLYDADVYGQIYDANHEPILQNRSRVGAIAEVPPGVSEFEIRITVPANQPTPLKLEKFKASGFAGKVSPLFE